MNLHGLFAILYTVVYVFDICDSKCDEYVIVFQELSCGKTYELMPTKIDEIVWKDLTYPYNKTEVYEEIQEYKECILEIDCNGHDDEPFACSDIIVPTNNTIIPGNNTGEKNEKSNKTGSEEVDNSIIDINIIYYINETEIKNSSNFTKSKSLVQCDYAETVCIHEKEKDNNSLSNRENYINYTRTLIIQLQRDPYAPIQPIFTGYFPQSLGNLSSIENNYEELKLATLECDLLTNINCRQNKYNKQIFIYVKTNYIQNVTIRYPNCTKDKNSSTNYSLSLSCDAKDFAYYNPHVQFASLFTFEENDEDIIKPSNQTNQDEFVVGVKDLLIYKCQITSNLNYTDIYTYDSNVIRFNNCSIFRNIKNDTKFGDITLTEDEKAPYIDNITTKNIETIEKLNTIETIHSTKINNDHLSGINKDTVFTISIIENAENCSHDSLSSIHSVKIILEDDVEARNSKEKILKNNNVVLNISNCINFNSSVLNNTEMKAELAIVLKKNCSLNTSKVFDKNPAEAGLEQKYMLKCDRPYLDADSSKANVNKTILECESIYLEDVHNTTDVDIKKQNTSDGKAKVNTDHAEKYHNETKINTDEPKIKNDTLNATSALDEHNYTDHTKEHHNETKINTGEPKIKNDTLNVTSTLDEHHCTDRTEKHHNETKINTDEPTRKKYPSNETIALNEHNRNNHTRSDNSTKYVQNKELENDTTSTTSKDISIFTTFNRKKTMAKGLGQESFAPETIEPIKLFTIILASIAGISILVIIALRKCTKKGSYQPTPTREPPDEEETAF